MAADIDHLQPDTRVRHVNTGATGYVIGPSFDEHVRINWDNFEGTDEESDAARRDLEVIDSYLYGIPLVADDTLAPGVVELRCGNVVLDRVDEIRIPLSRTAFRVPFRVPLSPPAFGDYVARLRANDDIARLYRLRQSVAARFGHGREVEYVWHHATRSGWRVVTCHVGELTHDEARACRSLTMRSGFMRSWFNWARRYAADDAKAYRVFDGDLLVGWCHVYREPVGGDHGCRPSPAVEEDGAWIRWAHFYVRSSHRRRGIGTALARAVFDDFGSHVRFARWDERSSTFFDRVDKWSGVNTPNAERGRQRRRFAMTSHVLSMPSAKSWRSWLHDVRARPLIRSER